MIAGGKPAPLKWLIRSLVAGAVFIVLMVVAFFGTFAQSAVMFQACGACLALCLIVAAVAFVLEVVRRTTGPS